MMSGMAETISRISAVFWGGFVGTGLRVCVAVAFAHGPLYLWGGQDWADSATGVSTWTLVGKNALFTPEGATVHPWYLLTVNLVGAFVLGALTGLGLRRQRRLWHTEMANAPAVGVPARVEWWRLFLGTGMCGAFTTYGSLIMLTAGLSPVPEADSAAGIRHALLWSVVILVAGLLCAHLGWMLGEGRGRVPLTPPAGSDPTPQTSGPQVPGAQPVSDTEATTSGMVRS